MTDQKPQHHYTKDNLTIYWEPQKCTHSGICARSMPTVFKPKERPWVQPDGAASAQMIADQIDQCPSGALSYKWADQPSSANSAAPISTAKEVKITPDGPILIKGPLKIDYQGQTLDIPEGKQAALCRCGASQNKPMCDGSHKQAGFKD